MVSPLSPINWAPQPQESSTLSALKGGIQFNQNRQMNDQAIQQNEFALQRQPIEAQQRDQAFEQNAGQADYQEALQRLQVINKLATKAKSLPTTQEREGFRNSLNLEMLKSVGIDPQQVTGLPLDDQSLDAIIAQTSAALPSSTGAQRVQSSQQLPGGLSVQTMADGTVRVVNASGEQLQGAQAQKAVDDARLLGIETERDKNQAREGGKLDAQMDTKALIEEQVTRAQENAKNATGQQKEFYTQLGNIQSNIANYNEAIRLIDEGAATGVVQSKLPSIRAASQKLDNVKNRLGLDVIGNTTFGALSESELAFAIDTALPTNLEGPDLRAWLERKRDAQQKLASYISSAMQFLDIPGNSLADLQAASPRQDVNAQPAQSATPEANTFTSQSGVTFTVED